MRRLQVAGELGAIKRRANVTVDGDISETKTTVLRAIIVQNQTNT